MHQPAVIQLEHYYPHAPARVWEALTDPELHARWWAAGDIRPIVGHRFDLDMGAFGKQACEVLEVVPEQKLVLRFAVGVLDTTITWRLVPDGIGTRLSLTHEGFDLDSPLARKALEGMGHGWPAVLGRLATTLSDA